MLLMNRGEILKAILKHNEKRKLTETPKYHMPFGRVSALYIYIYRILLSFFCFVEADFLQWSWPDFFPTSVFPHSYTTNTELNFEYEIVAPNILSHNPIPAVYGPLTLLPQLTLIISMGLFAPPLANLSDHPHFLSRTHSLVCCCINE